MTVLLAVLLGLARPPSAYLQTAAGRVPLAVSSWCWGSRCGAPIAKSSKQALVSRGATLRLELGFVPSTVSVSVVGRPVSATRSGHEVRFKATEAGGLQVRAAGGRGWVVYVGRIALR